MTRPIILLGQRVLHTATRPVAAAPGAGLAANRVGVDWHGQLLWHV